MVACGGGHASHRPYKRHERTKGLDEPTPDLEVPPVNLVMALGIVCCLGAIVRREKARDRADNYQMSEAWLADLHLGQKAPFRRVWKRRAGPPLP